MNQKTKDKLKDKNYQGELELSALIDACGENFEKVELIDKKWLAFATQYTKGRICHECKTDWNEKINAIGETPEEAVAKLWIGLQEIPAPLCFRR